MVTDGVQMQPRATVPGMRPRPRRVDDLAWDLVEEYRDVLTAEQRCQAFVYLGVGDHLLAIRCVLTSLVAQHKTLSEGAAADVRGWISSYQLQGEFGDLLLQSTGTTAELPDSPS